MTTKLKRPSTTSTAVPETGKAEIVNEELYSMSPPEEFPGRTAGKIYRTQLGMHTKRSWSGYAFPQRWASR